MHHLPLLKAALLAIGLAFVVGPTSGQDANWFVEAGAGYLIPDGATRLVRGTRKVVTTDMLNTGAVSLTLARRMSVKRFVMLVINRSVITYDLKEDYAGGLKIYSSDSFTLTSVNLGVRQYLGRSRVRPFGALGAGLARYGGDINWLGEEYLNPRPEDEIVVTPYKYRTHNTWGLHAEVGADLSLTSRLSLTTNVALYLTELQASLVNDPEDDGRDIEQAVNGVSLNLGVAYRF